jgi:hypothetical protein
MQNTPPSVGEYQPIGQLKHVMALLADAFEYFPLEHGIHLVLQVSGFRFPSVHGKQ